MARLGFEKPDEDELTSTHVETIAIGIELARGLVARGYHAWVRDSRMIVRWDSDQNE